MLCPCCKTPLTQKIFENIKIDVCICGGIWFDRNELKDSCNQEVTAKSIIDNAPNSSESVKSSEELLICPRCEIIRMTKYYFARRKVIADQCAKCGGVWLDAKEFGIIYNDTVSQKKQQEFEDILKKINRNAIINEIKKKCDIEKSIIKKLSDTVSEMVEISEEKLNLSQVNHESSLKIKDINSKDRISKEKEKFVVDSLRIMEDMVGEVESEIKQEVTNSKAKRIKDLDFRFKESLNKLNNRVESLRKIISRILND